MERLNHEEVLNLLKDTLIFKNTPDKMRPMLMVSVMDLSDEIQDEIERRNAHEPDEAFYERGLQMWKNLGLDKVA